MKLVQIVAAAALIFAGTFGITTAATAGPLSGAPALHAAGGDGSLVIQVLNNKKKKGQKGGGGGGGGNPSAHRGGHHHGNAATAAGIAAGIGIVSGIIANQQRVDDADDDDDDVDDVDDDAPRYRLHCRFGVWVDHRGVPHCRR